MMERGRKTGTRSRDDKMTRRTAPNIAVPKIDCNQRRICMLPINSSGPFRAEAENVSYSSRWNHCPGFHAAGHPRSKPHALRFEGKTRDPGVLSRRLEPGLRRSDDALQRDSPGVPQAQRRIVGHFGRRGVVPCGLCPGPSPAFSGAIAPCNRALAVENEQRAVADTLARTIGAVFPCHLALGFEIGEVSAIQMRLAAA